MWLGRAETVVAISVLVITFAAACDDDGQTTDSYSYLFSCDEFISKLKQINADLIFIKEYYTARQIECDAARGKTGNDYRNISWARFNVAESYASFGELERAAEMYKASVAALSIADSWKNPLFCGTASMAAGRLASLSNISQDERAQYAKRAAYWGSPNGTYFYARYLERGEGALRDLVSAYAWYNVTAAYADGPHSGVAQEALARLDSVLPVQTRIEAQSLSRAIQADIDSRKDCKYMIEG